MHSQCEQGSCRDGNPCSKALAGRRLPSALLCHHSTEPGALHAQDTVTAPYVTHIIPSAPSSPKRTGFVSQHKAQTSCAMSAAHRLLQPWLNPKKQLHCRKAELTFLFPKGGAAASEAARTLGEQQAGTGWMQSHGLGLGRKTGCNWKGQFIRETSHCREVTTHWKGSRPAEGGQSSAAAQIYIPQPQKPSRCHRGKGLPGTQLMFYKQPERRASSKVPKKASLADNS